MDLSSEEDVKKPVNAITTTQVMEAKAGKRFNFGNVKFGTKRRSTTSIFSSAPTTPAPIETAIQTVRPAEKGHLTRTRSEEVARGHRDDWATGILAQPEMQQSMIALRSSVNDYEREATQQQWKDLLKIHADVRELSDLAHKSNKHKAADEATELSEGGLSKFSTVALEYSKLLDVVMNQTPEYAALAWGVRLPISRPSKCALSLCSGPCRPPYADKEALIL